MAAQIVIGDSIESAELRAATDKLLLAQIEAGQPLLPVEAAQVFMTAWITEVAESEILAVLADGSRSADEIRGIGRQVRGVIRACVEGLVSEGMETMDTEAVFNEVFRRAKQVMSALGVGR